MFPPHDNSPPHLLSRNATGQLSLYALPPRALRTIAFFLNAYDRASWAATATHFQNSVRIQSECITEKYRRLAAIFTIPAIDLSSSMLFFFFLWTLNYHQFTFFRFFPSRHRPFVTPCSRGHGKCI